MGRPRAFAKDTVLFAAANEFRQRGYRDASIADLEAATGIVAGSIYNAFGGKAGLFRAALDHYVHGFVADRLKRFAGEGATLEDLEGLYLSVLKPPLADGFGCLVTNSIVEFGREVGPATESVNASLNMVRDAISNLLTQELGSEVAATQTGPLLIFYHGILTLSRSNVPAEELTGAVRSTFAQLKGMRSAGK
jgi:AcrR family transcriptional regulator